jgi:hypothetical protein
MKVTFPVAAEGDVVAVRDKVEPATGFVGEAVNTVELDCTAVTVTVGEVLPERLMLPPYTAV